MPARGGSKGIPNRNLMPIDGRPLLAYTADAARHSSRLSRTILGTDDQRIAEVARALGIEVSFLRPGALAADNTPMLPLLRHALDAMRGGGFETDGMVLLQPTSPFRRGEHIDAALELLESCRADSVVSVVEVPHQFNPVSVLRFDERRLWPFLDDAPISRSCSSATGRRF